MFDKVWHLKEGGSPRRPESVLQACQAGDHSTAGLLNLLKFLLDFTLAYMLRLR